MWLARLTEWGMLRPCFVPPAPIRALRDYTRARTTCPERTRCWQRLEKLLEGALIKLSSVASKLTTQSAQDMITAMIAGPTRASWRTCPAHEAKHTHSSRRCRDVRSPTQLAE